MMRKIYRSNFRPKKETVNLLKIMGNNRGFQDLVNEGLLSNISGKKSIKKIARPQKLKKGRG